MKYLSVCSGIEAASVAWHGLGWQPVGFSEIEPFPSAVLAHRFPSVPNYGDMTNHATWPIEPGSIDVLVGGTPCQSFSVAGLRAGLADPRGGLMLTYLEIAQRLRPRWVVWENVPGVLSSNGGRDFGSFLGALGQLGYGWAYRILDAEWCRTHGHPRAVPQRRRRVFVVGCLGDWERAAQVLFERESVQRDSSPRRAKGQGVAADAEGCVGTVSSKCAKGTGGYAGVNKHENLTTWPAQIACTLNAAFSNSLGIEDQHALHGAPLFVPAVVGALTENGLGAPADAEAGAGAGCFYGGSDRDCADTVTSKWSKGSGGPAGNECGLFLAQPIGYRWQNDRDGLVQDGTAPACRASTGSSGFHEMNHPVVVQPFTKSKRAQSKTDDETWVDGQVNPTLSLFDQGDTRATTVAVAHAFYSTDGTHGVNQQPEVSPHVKVGSGLNIPSPPAVAQAMTVRRLTPRECERLQGFPDDWTLIPWRKKAAADCPDGPRYKALGNSMAVNCMEWIGERIDMIEKRNSPGV